MPALVPENAKEIVIQASCKKRVENEFDAYFVAIPNGTYIASAAGRGKVRQEGLSKGFPDAIIIGVRRNAGKTAFAEIKARSSLSNEQDGWLTGLAKSGHQCGVFRSQDTLAAKLREWGWQ
jgi:hypothetical protein